MNHMRRLDCISLCLALSACRSLDSGRPAPTVSAAVASTPSPLADVTSVSMEQLRRRSPLHGEYVVAGHVQFDFPAMEGPVVLRLCSDRSMRSDCRAVRRRADGTVSLPAGATWWTVAGSALAPQLLCVVDAAAPAGRVVSLGNDCRSIAPLLRWDQQYEVLLVDVSGKVQSRSFLSDADLGDAGIWPSTAVVAVPSLLGDPRVLFRVRSPHSFFEARPARRRQRIRPVDSWIGGSAHDLQVVGDVLGGQGDDVLVLGGKGESARDVDDRPSWRASLLPLDDPRSERVLDISAMGGAQFIGRTAFVANRAPGEPVGWLIGNIDRPAADLSVGVASVNGSLRMQLAVPALEAGSAGRDFGVSLAVLRDLDGDRRDEFAVFSHESSSRSPQLTLYSWSGDVPRPVRTVNLPGDHFAPEMFVLLHDATSCLLLVHSDRGAARRDAFERPAIEAELYPDPNSDRQFAATTTVCHVSIDSQRCSVVRQRGHGDSLQLRSWLSVVGDFRGFYALIGEHSDSNREPRVEVAPLSGMSVGAWRAVPLSM